MSSSSLSPNSSSGIIIDPSSGTRHIPSSTRPDGSKRKEIKIRPGYKPPEDVEVYKNRTAEAWKTKGVGAGVPGAAGLELEQENRTANTKNAKRREARKKAKAEEEGGTDTEAVVASKELKLNGDENEISSATASKLTQKETWRSNAATAVESLDPEVEKEKQARNLKKKLRQARELKEKKAKGENLLPEQFEKMIRINELIRQLDNLGFNADGEPKRE